MRALKYLPPACWSSRRPARRQGRECRRLLNKGTLLGGLVSIGQKRQGCEWGGSVMALNPRDTTPSIMSRR